MIMPLNQTKPYSTKRKGTKEPEVNTHLDWWDWWRMPRHEYRDVPQHQHLFTSKFMARGATGAVESNMNVTSDAVVLNAVSSI